MIIILYSGGVKSNTSSKPHGYKRDQKYIGGTDDSLSKI